MSIHRSRIASILHRSISLWSIPVLACLALSLAGCSDAPDDSSPKSTATSNANSVAPKSDSTTTAATTDSNSTSSSSTPGAAGSESVADAAKAPVMATEPATPAERATPDAAATAPTATSEPTTTKPAKAGRAPIYVEEANGKELIAAALKRAQRDHKHVLIEWGGNWCGWCFKLHDVFHKDSVVHPIVHEEYELVLIDQGKNHDLMLEYGGADRQYSFPHLTVLDSTGAVLTNQETGSLEKGPQHDPKLVADFLHKWMPEKQDAEQLLANALATAGNEKKAVLVRVGSPYCGWCTILSQFMQDHQGVFATDYVDLKIDTMRMVNGEQVASRLEPQGAGGIPWMVILDPSGKTLATSIGPGGNIGYPYQPEEIEHFVTMLKATKNRLTDAEMESIVADLNAYRVARETRK